MRRSLVALAAGALVAAAAGSSRGTGSSAAAAAAVSDWSSVDAVLTSAIAEEVFPGCAAGVLGPTGDVLYRKAFGSFVYPGQATPLGGNNPAVSPSGTLFDMASMTKIIGATSASALLYQAGLLDLDMPVADPSLLGPSYAQAGKGSVRVRDCLLHQAGYPPDPSPGYDDPAFGCPATALTHPPLTFNCSEKIFASLLAQPLQYPPTTAWLYSDLSMITMQYVLGTIVINNNLVQPGDLRPDCAGADPATSPGLARSCAFEAFVRTRVLLPSGFDVVGRGAGFMPPQAAWPTAMPTWNDSSYRHEIMQGVVSDENAYALGGIAGHAGVFAALDDMIAWTGMWAGYGAPAGFASLIQASTRSLFFAAPNPAFSPRALGWVTQAATDTYQGCGGMSDLTAYHTGYTGTMVCIDPTRNVSLVLLTNRVYPNSTGQADTIHTARQAFADAVLAVLASGGSSSKQL